MVTNFIFVYCCIILQPNTVCMAPPLVAFLCATPDLTSEDLSDLRVAINGAAPVALSHVKQLIQKVGNKDFVFKEGKKYTEISKIKK